MAAPVAPAGPTVAECDAQLARYRTALDAAADPTVVAAWIAEIQAERRLAEHNLDVYCNLGLRLTYNPATRTVRADIDLAAHRWGMVCV